MASDHDVEEQAVAGALAEFEKGTFGEFQKATPEEKTEFQAAARRAAQEFIKISKGLHPGMTLEEIESHFGTHLSKPRIELIKEALTLPTFRMRLEKKSDGQTWAITTRDRKEFKPPILLDSLLAMDSASYLQMASVIVEAILLLLSAVGVKVAVDKAVMTKTTEEVVAVVGSSRKLQDAVKALQTAFDGDSTWNQAKAIFYLAKDCKSAGILWTVIKGLCKNMTALEWIKTAATVTAMILAAFATDGVALIAKIVLALKSAYDFVQKIKNLNQLDGMKNE
eukprot:m.81724 g.81724  ORF g.81724 m.81724 type:complete len:281 (+) comp36246_c1_seq1:533-1375(+)